MSVEAFAPPPVFTPGTAERVEFVRQLFDFHRSQHPALDVIMVTYNNPEYLAAAIKSLLSTWHVYPFRLFLVNNGVPECLPPIIEGADIVTVLQQPKNRGWEGGVKAGLEASTTPFVALLNDDIQIPRASLHWARMCLELLKNPQTAAVGPTSNFVSGLQNLSNQPEYQLFPAAYLIGFFMVCRREALNRVGYPDLSLPGGDDLDLSMAVRAAGYNLIIRNDLFIFHHGQITGQRVHGDDWNSADMIDRTANALIRKHGLRYWFETVYCQHEPMTDSLFNLTSAETETCASWVPEPPAVVIEMGCGGQLTVNHAIGVDQYAEGEITPWKATSLASIRADVFRPMPMFNDEYADCIIARHILEHAVDPVQVVQEWRRILKPGGRLIIAVPNEELGDGIPMDHTHLHGFTPDSLRSYLELCGYRQMAYTPDCGNHMSSVSVFERVG